MTSARFVPAARREFLAEIVYYNEEQAGLGARFTAAVEDAAARALAFPHAGSPAAGNTWRVLLQGFPFSVVYREVPAGILDLPAGSLPGTGDEMKKLLAGCGGRIRNRSHLKSGARTPSLQGCRLTAGVGLRVGWRPAAPTAESRGA